MAFSAYLPASPGCTHLTTGYLFLRQCLSSSPWLSPYSTFPSAPVAGLCSYVFLLLLLSSLTFSSASSLYFQQLLLASHIFPDAFLPLFSLVGVTQGSFIPLLAQVSGVGFYTITFTMLLHDGKAFSSQPTQFQIYSNQDFILTMEHTSY